MAASLLLTWLIEHKTSNVCLFGLSAEEPPVADVVGTPPCEQDMLLLSDPPAMLQEVHRLRERVLELEVKQQHETARHKSWPRPEEIQQLQVNIQVLMGSHWSGKRKSQGEKLWSGKIREKSGNFIFF